MKIPKARQLPSGSWRVQIMLDGKMVSVTCNTEAEAIAKAMQYKVGNEDYKRNPLNITVSEAMARYIEANRNVLAVSTLAGYSRMSKNCLQGLQKVKLASLTNEKIQREISVMSRQGKSAKYISNAVGFLSPVLGMYHPNFKLDVNVPQITKYEQRKLTIDEVGKILAMTKGTDIELPILLAIWLGLRRSEILGLRTKDINQKTHILHVRNATVQDEHNQYVDKTTKTTAGDRYIYVPDYIFEKIDFSKEKVTDKTGHAIYMKMSRLAEKNGIDHFRLHDLRSANAAVQMYIGLERKYIKERNGWSSDKMLVDTYAYLHDEYKEKANKQIDNFFADLARG